MKGILQEKHMKEYFMPIVRYFWIVGILASIIAIINARILSDLISNATRGRVEYVLLGAGLLLGIFLLYQGGNLIFAIKYEKKKVLALQNGRQLFYKQFFSLPLHFLHMQTQGDTIEKLNDDFMTITGVYLTLKPTFGIGCITLLGYFIFLCVQSPIIAICLFLISLIQVITPIVIARYMQVNYENCREIESDITDFFVHSHNAFVTIKLFDLKKRFMDELSKQHRQYLKIGNISEVTQAAENSLEAFVENLLLYGTYALMGVFVLLHISTMEVAIQAIALSGGFYAAMKKIFKVYPDFKVAKTAMKRVSFWFESPKPVIGKRKSFLSPSDKTISLEDVSFQFDEKKILNHLSCVWSTEQITLIKGENGIGKSTLFEILMGLRMPDSGDIKICGLDSIDIASSNNHDLITYLPQNDLAFSITAMELYQAMEASGQIQISNCISLALRFGLTETLLNSSLTELSGGELKKVYLAFAFTSSKHILLLDEPTNSLDLHGKQVLVELLQERKGGVIMISHDSFLSEAAQEVYTFEEGGNMYRETN